MGELWEETPCEHGQLQHHMTPEVGPNYTDSGLVQCPGGSRRRVTIDYEAAKRQIDHEYDDDLPLWNVQLVVDAALITEETPK